MKLEKHIASSRGYANHGWLQATHSFSFANWFNPNRLHFGALRVLNDDLIAPSMGFSTHPHQNMEIITIPLKGVLKHKDNMADEWLYVKPNEVQVMSAGTGVYHSEVNGSANEHLSLFQIWIIPDKEDVTPRYDQMAFNPEERKNKQQIIVSSIDDDKKGLKIHQDALISRIDLEEGKEFTYHIKSENHGVYLLNISGDVTVDKEKLTTRDALGISQTQEFKIKANEYSELLMIEVPMIGI
ncbi:pirin family protein [Tenacibaculum sp. IB213877]|uniref:pirin family protein n=1 Tax=Tenacibaculum sp. IB213877 TaxID=3097351 RepID=UPI002A5A3880|nr:pirin family protein [Tenacibaculum sp. IB213877]MDY0779990.1 pirin family protein [Tenacibaculum sp. IB213877]